MASFQSSVMALTYISGATTTMAIRYRVPNINSGYKMKYPYAISLLAIFSGSLIFIWTGWNNIYKAIILLIIFFISYSINSLIKKNHVNFKYSIWLIIYFLLIVPTSYLSNFGGINYYNVYCITFMVLLISIITLHLAQQKIALERLQYKQQ